MAWMADKEIDCPRPRHLRKPVTHCTASSMVDRRRKKYLRVAEKSHCDRKKSLIASATVSQEIEIEQGVVLSTSTAGNVGLGDSASTRIS
jgi:hypothetical protein